MWVLLDIAIVLLALAVLGLVGFSLYKHVRGLFRTVSATSEEVSRLTEGLQVRPSPSVHPRDVG